MSKKVDCIDVINKIGIDNITDCGNQISFSCPYPNHKNGDRNPSATMNKNTMLFFCFGCHEKGDIYSLIEYQMGVSTIQARMWLEEGYGGDVSKKDDFVDYIKSILDQEDKPVKQEEDNQVIEQNICDDYLESVNWTEKLEGYNSIEYVYKYLFLRGFLAKTLDYFNIYVDKSTNRVAIPVKNLRGKIVGFKARSTSQDVLPKYILLGDKEGKQKYGFRPCKLSIELFNSNSHNGGEVILCEGELDAMKLHQLGYQSVAISGSSISERQQRIVAEKYSSVICYFDSDSAGKSSTKKVFDCFYKHLPVSSVKKHEKDPCSDHPSNIRELIANANNYAAALANNDF